jgi:outer membrane protein assembly factor BamB
VYNNRLFIATDEGVLWCLHAGDGNILGRHDFGNVILSTPVIEGNELFTCANEKPGVECTQTQGTVLHPLDADDMSPLWSHESSTPAGVLPLLMCSSPSVSGSRVYYGSVDGKLYALQRTDGSEIWTPYDGGSRIYSNPAVEGGFVFFTSSNAVVRCVGEADGQPVWTFSAPYVTDVCLP